MLLPGLSIRDRNYHKKVFVTPLEVPVIFNSKKLPNFSNELDALDILAGESVSLGKAFTPAYYIY